MASTDRQQTILQLLDASGQLTISELSSRFSVSEMTIRRDLALLEGEGLLRRTHGGATRTTGGAFEPPFALRSHRNLAAKQAIAADVAARIKDGQTIVIDGGSTGVAVAEALVGRAITVCALNMRVAETLSASPATRVMVPGGFVRHGEQSFTGPAAERTLSDHRFDTYVMTVSALDVEAGLTEWSVEDAAVKRAALAASSWCIVACDSSKIGETAFARVADLSQADVIVTDAALAAEQRQALALLQSVLHIA